MPHFQTLEKFHNLRIFLFVSFNLDLKLESAKNESGKVKGDQRQKEH